MQFVTPGLSPEIKPVDLSRYTYLMKRSQCVFPSQMPSYLDNLLRLGLVKYEGLGSYVIDVDSDGTMQSYVDLTRMHPKPTDASLVSMLASLLGEELAAYKETIDRFYISHCDIVKINDFGKQFMEACANSK
jgi:hypothetical protein